MISIVSSRNGIPIRLTDERWVHITEEHCELAGLRAEVIETIGDPERVLEGKCEELLAIREIDQGKWLVVIYRETGYDGFVITAFLTRRIRSLSKRKQVWPL